MTHGHVERSVALHRILRVDIEAIAPAEKRQDVREALLRRDVLRGARCVGDLC